MEKEGLKKKVPRWIHPVLIRFEHFTEWIIPYLLVILAILLILENPFWTLVHLDLYEPWITFLDEFIIGFFVIDLVFKWFRVRHILKFLKLFWLDIIAVFPFFLIFRLYVRFATVLNIGKEISEAQKFAHEAVLIREARLIRETELLKETRLLKELKPATRLLRAVQRFLRVLKARFIVASKSAKVYLPGQHTKLSKRHKLKKPNNHDKKNKSNKKSKSLSNKREKRKDNC